MGGKSSKNVVADTVSEDESQSYNLINVHTPTASMGITVFFCLVGVVLLVRLYMHATRRAWCTRPKASPGGRRLPTRRDTVAVDMDGHTGHVMPAQGVAVLQGTDAKNSYWTPRDSPCWTCMEEAWTDHGHRRARAPRSREDLVSVGRAVYGGPRTEEASPAPRQRARWTAGGREDSPPPRRRTRSVESF